MRRRDPMGIGYDPDILRTLHGIYSGWLVALESMRQDAQTLPELVGIAAIVDEVTAKRDGCQRRLDRIECQRHTEARRAAFGAGVPA